jgi:PAT family beta-lactamase induction signal transducer AmpG
VGVPGLIATALLLMLLGFLVNLPRLKRRLYASDSFYARAFVDYLDQPRIGVILAFLVLNRTGESFLLAMVYPLLKDLGIGRAQYGLIYGTFGIAASILGSIVGGIIIGKVGLRRAAWPLVLFQNVPNLLYAVLAAIFLGGFPVTPLGSSPTLPVVGAFVVMEAFGAGMGTAFFLVFIMRTCKPGHSSAHMATATSVMNVSSTLAGVGSGFLANWLGFPLFFAFTFLATVPAMSLVPFLPHLGEGKG